jgi:pilus assembly protein FimV
VRNTKQAIAALCLINSSSAFALGIGDITTHSALNQVLNAKIPLVSSKNEDPTNISVDLASRETFKQAGIDRPQYLSDLKFTPIVSANGDVSITVTSSSSIKEPFVNFILEVEWPQGRTLKEFTILLDPPITMADVTTAPIELVKSSNMTAVPITNTQTSTPVRSNAQTNPEQLVSNYGPTRSNDTVWGIAKKLLSNNNGISHEQMMMALFENNPKAFYKNNINALMKGQVLQVPNRDTVNQLSAQQAQAAFSDQNIQWSASARAKQEQVSSNTSNDSSSNTPNEAKLTLLTPDEPVDNQTLNADTSNVTSPTATSDSSNAVNQANIALEMATTNEQENREVKSRLSELETQVEKLQRLIALKDDQLAQLQTKPVEITKTIPAKKPAPTAVEPEETEETEESMLPLYAGGGLLIALLGLFLARRKKSNDQPFPMPEESANEKRDLFEETMSEIEVEEELPTTENDTHIESESLLSEFTPSEFENLDESLEADPLTECDVYIAYGRYQQAEDLIQKSIEEDPSNEAYKFKLLDVYYSSENSSAFESLAKDLDHLKTSDPEMWNNISTMGADICPESILFVTPMNDNNQHDDLSDADLSDAVEETNETMLSLEDEVTEELDSLDFEVPETTTEQPGTSDDISLDLAEEPMKEENPSDEDNNEFDFDFDLIKPGEDSNDSVDANADTKLSLAEAYIDMLDMESAKEALDEVIETGNAEQIEKAKSLLEKL